MVQNERGREKPCLVRNAATMDEIRLRKNGRCGRAWGRLLHSVECGQKKDRGGFHQIL